jgi:hypothetical protein
MEIMPEHSKHSCILTNSCGHRFTGEALRSWAGAGKRTCPKCEEPLRIQDSALIGEEARDCLLPFYGVYRSSPSGGCEKGGAASKRPGECSVCVSTPEPSTANKILECSSCGVRVHQLCCGVVDDPPARWLCPPCKDKLDTPPACALCPLRGGVLQRVKGGGWVHLICALWLPELGFEDPATMKLVRSADHVDPMRFKLVRCSRPALELVRIPSPAFVLHPSISYAHIIIIHPAALRVAFEH